MTLTEILPLNATIRLSISRTEDSLIIRIEETGLEKIVPIALLEAFLPFLSAILSKATLQ